MAADAGSFLVRTGLIGSDELAPVRRGAAERKITIYEEAVLSNWVSDDALTESLGRELGLSRLRADDLAAIPTRVIELLPKQTCIAYRMIPTARGGDRLEVALSNPGDERALADAATRTGLKVVPVLATQLQIAWCLAHYYGVVTPLGQTLLEQAKTPPPAHAAPPDRAPRRAPRSAPRAPTERDDERDLRPRAGEIAVRSEEDATPASSRQDLPAVVLDDSLELHEALRRTDARQIDSPRETLDDEDSEIIYLTPDKRRARADTQTGLPPPANRSPRLADRADHEDEIVTEPGRYPPTLGLANDEGADNDPHPGEAVSEVAIDDASAPRRQLGDTEEPTDPAASPELIDGEPTAPSARADEPTSKHDDSDQAQAETDDAPDHREHDLPPAPETTSLIPEDEDFGPPGTTIPPPFLGAIPQSYEDVDSSTIPIRADDDGFDDSLPHRASSPPRDDDDPYAELETASAELVETLHALESSSERDEVIEELVAHAAARFDRAAFFVIRAETLHLWEIRGRCGEAPGARVLEVPAFAAASERGRPYRGAISDDATRGYLAAWLGDVPDEILAVPVSVRDRVVGILYGDSPSRRIYDEHVTVLARAAGDAFERVLRARKRS